jgi:pimeloyl-ACP methyl ester carboxylesterase
MLSPFVLYFTFRPWGVDESVLKAAANLKVLDQDVALIFEPKEAKSSGLLLVPGCPVDPIAYAPLARRIAEQGHRAVIVKVPLRCAPLPEDQNVLDHRVRSLATRWENHRFVLAAHSLGALHATRILTSAVERFAGFVLMGASQRGRDLKGLPMPVTKIVATKDGFAGASQEEAGLLPAEARVVTIEGGNNSQFGYYGFQLFDGIPDISREVQQEQVTSALLEALARVASPVPAPTSRRNSRRAQARNAG